LKHVILAGKTDLYFGIFIERVDMIVKKYSLDKYMVIEISDEFTVVADLQELEIFIDGLIIHNQRYLALRFHLISYIYSGALAVLVKIAKKFNSQMGEICLLEPNYQVNDIIKITNLDSVIAVYNSEEALLEHSRSIV